MKTQGSWVQGVRPISWRAFWKVWYQWRGAGATAEAVEGLLQTPVGSGGRVGASFGRDADTDLILWEGRLAEGILGVALLGSTARGNRPSDHDPDALFGDDGGIEITLFPVAVLMIPKDHSAGLGTEGLAIGVRFDGEDAHGGDRLDAIAVTKALVLGLIDHIVCEL